MDSSASVSSCSFSSGEISSAKPVKVHTSYYPILVDNPPLSARGSPLPVPFLDTHGSTDTGRLVDRLYYRKRLASFFEVYGWLAVLSYGLDEVLDLLAVGHGEAARVRASAGSGLDLAVPFHDLFGLVFVPACAVGVSLLVLAGGVEVPQLVVVDDGRALVPVHGYPGREPRVGSRRRDDVAEGAA